MATPTQLIVGQGRRWVTIAPATLPDALTVDVELPDIHEGLPCSSRYCVLALAVGRALRRLGIRFADISVTHRTVEVVTDWRTPAFSYWHDAQSLVNDFDAYRRIEPRSVSLIRMQRAAA